MAKSAPLRERHSAKFVCLGPNDCWPWRAHRNKKNFGMVADGRGSSWPAHRVAYALANGMDSPDEIPKGLTVDHTCHNIDDSCVGGNTCEHRACQNPAHLEAVDGIENVARGKSFSAMNARKTHCTEGHELTEENSYGWPNRRQCKICTKKRTAARQEGPQREAILAYKREWSRQH